MEDNMIKTEFYKTREDGVDLYRTYSDINKYILQIETEIIYDEVIDVGDKYNPTVDFGHESEKIRYTYEETEKDIEKEEKNE
jgi:hypothetical protein